MSSARTRTNANAPEYPCEQGTDPNGCWNQTFGPGLSKREYIAALALQAILSNTALLVVEHEMFSMQAATFAKQAVAFADVLLMELECWRNGEAEA